MKIRAALLSAVLFFFTSQSAHAVDVPSLMAEPASPELDLGFYLSVMGDVSPALFAVNVAYEYDDDWRFSAGVGTLFGLSVGAGARYYLISLNPSVNLLAGLNAGLVFSTFGSSFGNALSTAFGGTPGPVTADAYGYFGPSLGLDWKMATGVYLALNGNLWISTAANVNVVPNVSFGWFL